MAKENVVRARIDNETKAKIMFIVKTKGETLSKVVREALEDYAKKNSK